jgi:hypothetical protein
MKTPSYSNTTTAADTAAAAAVIDAAAAVIDEAVLELENDETTRKKKTTAIANQMLNLGKKELKKIEVKALSLPCNVKLPEDMAKSLAALISHLANITEDPSPTPTEACTTRRAELISQLKSSITGITKEILNPNPNQGSINSDRPTEQTLTEAKNTLTEVEELVARVTTYLPQLSYLALTVSSLAEAATTLAKLSEEKLKQSGEGEAVRSKQNAAKLIVPLVDTVSLKTYLDYITESLTSAKKNTETEGAADDKKFEKWECEWNLTTAAILCTKVATDLGTSTGTDGDDTSLHMISKHFASMAISLTTVIEKTREGPIDQALLKKQRKTVEAVKDLTKTISYLHMMKPQRMWWWQFCAYSMFFPLCCLFNHFNYIIIAFIHDLYHATSVAIAYGVIILFLYLMLDNIPYVLRCTKNMLALQGMKFVAIILLLGYVVIDIVLYFYIPIRNAFDDAANHFISVYNTIAVLFTTLVLYVIIKHRSTSPIRVFTRAMDSLFYKDEKATHLNIKRGDWEELSEEDKDTEVAKSLLKKIQ